MTRSRPSILITAVAALALAPVAAAHEGSAHAGTPHWLLLLTLTLGVTIAAAAWILRDRLSRKQSIATGFLGFLVVTLSAIGLVEIQVEPRQADVLFREWYPELSLILGVTIVTASLLLGWLRWRSRPRLTVLGMLLGLWIGYPTYVPGDGLRHPTGYLVVTATLLAVAYVLYRDVLPALKHTAGDRQAWLVAGVTSLVFTAFFLFSAGLLSTNPETGTINPDEGFFILYEFSNPLVIWPAIEFYVPSIPLVAAVSVGTAVVAVLLTGLVGVNAVLATHHWRSDAATTKTLTGAFATTGATACCCCAPAVYGVTSAALGATATPIYWALVDPTSPLGSLFFITATALLTAGAIETAETIQKQRPMDN